MAEDNTGFSPLDPLGPEYGSINPVRPDIKSLTPFEGERLRDAPINFPEPKYYPIMPGVDLDNPSQAIRKNVVGSPGNPPSKKASFEELKKANIAFLKSRVATSADPNQYGKIYSYDAGPSGNAFYKRYMAYGTKKFDEIGFSPLRDNEALFNARTTRMDDFKRMMTHSFIPLFSNGFTSGPKSLMKMLSGDFTSSDLEDARAYEEAAAIGQSTKGGVFGFTNNLMMNFAYTAGIISEAVLEEVGGALLAPVTGGSSLFAATANNARKASKLGSALGAAVDGMKAVRSTISNLSDLRYARNFKNSVEKLSTTTLGRIVNPLENTLEAISDIRKIKATDNISSLAQISKTAGGLYRDARNINMALSEARLEAGMVENKVYDELYNQFYEANDRAPSNAEQSAMIKQSKDAATNTLFWNAGIIYASNKITFDNITGPRGGLRNFVKSTTDDVMSVGGGKFGNLGKIVYNKVDEVFTFEGNNIKELAKSWWKNPGFKTAAKTVGYLKANFMEGIQENLQEVIAGANEKYYIETFNSRGRRASEYSKGLAGYAEKSQRDYFAEELGAQISMQGLETFASGFLMGTLAAPLNNAVPFFTHGYNRIFNKDEFQKYKDMKTRVTTGIIEDLNEIKINDFLKSKQFSYGTQDILASIKKNGTKKEAMDAELESLIKATGTMVRTNTVDVFTDKLKTYTEMTDEELVDAIKGITIDEAPKYRQRVFNSIERIERIKDRYDYYTDKMPNPINPEELESMDKSSKEYRDRVALYNGWNLAVENAVFFNEAFEDTSKRMVDIQQKFLNNTTLKKTGQREMNLLFRPDTIIEEVDLLENELKALEGMETKSPAVQKQIQQKKKAIESYKEFYAKQQMFNLFFNRGDYYDIIKARLKKELKREPTEAELDEAFNSEIGKIDDQTKAEEVTSDLRVAFYDYMKNVAAANEDTVFDDNLEKGFVLLLDHYKLGQESRSMVEYINTLHNPKSFFEVANRNSAWMQQLYKNRVKYYEAMVKAEINSVEDNALLNALADKGIFVSLEDFAKWQEDRTAPTEFFDNVNKKVYTQGTDEYDTYYELFRQAEELKDETTDVTTNVLQKELQDNLEALQVQKEQEIESLPATEVETERVPIQRPEGSKTMGLKNVFEDMQDGDYVEVTRKQKKQLVKEIYYRDGDTLVVGDKGGEVVDLEKSKFRVVKASKYRVEMQADPAQVEAINTKYDELEEQLKAESPVQLPTDSEGNIAERITNETLLSEYPPEIYNQLSDIYGQMQVDNGVDITSIPIEQYEQEFFNWIKTSPQAKEVIDAYNNSLSPAPVEKTPVSDIEAQIADIERRRQEELVNKLGEIALNKKSVDIIAERNDKKAVDFIDTYDNINAKYDAELAALESKQTQPNIVKVYHHTTVAPQNFDFGNFQRGKNQISQFGDGLNAATTTNSFFVSRYGDPIEGEIDDSEFIVIDANKSQKEIYEMLVSRGFKFNSPQLGKATAKGGTYVGGTAASEYDDTSPLKDSPGAAMDLFKDFQESNPQVKGVKVLNHIIGGQKVDPFYVIYDAKSFYGPGSLSKTSALEGQEGGVAAVKKTELALKEKQEVVNLGGKDYTYSPLATSSTNRTFLMHSDKSILIRDEFGNAAEVELSNEPISENDILAGAIFYMTAEAGVPRVVTIEESLPDISNPSAPRKYSLRISSYDAGGAQAVTDTGVEWMEGSRSLESGLTETNDLSKKDLATQLNRLGVKKLNLTKGITIPVMPSLVNQGSFSEKTTKELPKEFDLFSNIKFNSPTVFNKTFNSIGAAIIAAKLAYIKEYSDSEGQLTEEGQKLIDQISNATPANLDSINTMINRRLSTATWGEASQDIIESLTLEAYSQNRELLSQLLASGKVNFKVSKPVNYLKDETDIYLNALKGSRETFRVQNLAMLNEELGFTIPTALNLLGQTNWEDIISKATERELDAIIDQIDKADQMTPELLDLITNKRQEYAIKNSKKGDQLIAKKDVFYKNKSGENAIFTSAFSTAVITKVDEKTGKISIKPLGADTEITLSINEINAKFNLKETVETPEIVVASMKITDEDKSNIAESSDNVDSFANNAAKHEEIQGRVESKDVTIEDLDDDVLNDLEC